MPSASVWKLDTNKNITISDAQPSIVLPANQAAKTQINATIDSANKIKPNVVTIRSGLIENDVIPSDAKASIFDRVYFVSP